MEIWPFSLVVPKGFRIALTVQGKDLIYSGYVPEPGQSPSKFDSFSNIAEDGIGSRRHSDPLDRPPEIFDGNVTVHFDKDKRPYLLLPVVPPKK